MRLMLIAARLSVVLFVLVNPGSDSTRSSAADRYEGSPVAAALVRADAAVEKIVAVPAGKRTLANTIVAIDDLTVQVRLDTEFLQFMAYVSPDTALRNQGHQAEVSVRNWMIAVMKRADLYGAVRKFADTNPELGEQDARLLERLLRDYRRAGMSLTVEKRDALKVLQVELSKKSIEFESIIRADETRVPLTRAELKGMPAQWLEIQPISNGIFLIGMDYPSFLPLMDYCEIEATRQKVWIAYKRRGGLKNVRQIEKILTLRAKVANLLGYSHPADFETEIRMSKSAQAVIDFYQTLRPKLRKKARLDFAEFTRAKRKHTGRKDAKLKPWDQSFYEKRLMREKYSVDPEKVRQYFPLNRVIDGLFSITQSLYGLSYREITEQAGRLGTPVWHPDVKFFEVTDIGTGQVMGRFFLDLHPRPNKYGHAAQWGLHPRKEWADGRVQKPLAALVCNFTKPTKDAPSLLSHDEVETFFHEFGHCLHSVLTESKYGEFSGTSVARDFVEAPSQMFEHWVWDAKVLKTFARHYRTGAEFPAALLAGMVKAKYLGSGMKAEHQIYYGMVDMTYHLQPDGKVDTTQVGLDLFEEIELYDAVPGTHFQAAFGHLTGYQAGYYGYLWSLVYAEDMFQRFKELGMLSPKAGREYREKILSRGGTVDELQMVREFLGREPRMEPFLKNLGLEIE